MTIGAAAGGLTPGGLAFLILAWGGISALTVYCFYKVLKTQGRNR
jgi:hypothetical protein